MTTIGSQITSLAVVYSTVYSDAYQRKHQSSASLAFVWGIHRNRWIPRTKGQLRGKCFHLMTSSWTIWDIFVLHRVYYQRGVVDIYCHHPAVTNTCYTLICLTQYLIDSEFYLFYVKTLYTAPLPFPLCNIFMTTDKRCYINIIFDSNIHRIITISTHSSEATWT